MTAEQLAQQLEATVNGDVAREVSGLGSLSSAGENDLSFLEDAKFIADAERSLAGTLICGEFAVEALSRSGKTLLVVKHPRLAFAKAAAALAANRKREAGVHPSAIVDATATLAPDVTVGALAVIGPRVRVGSRTVIGPGCVLLGDSEIGSSCELVARVTVYPQTRIGDRVIAHAGCVLGGDGFGFVPDSTGRFHKFPQIGRLEIGNDVELGANVTIDRGALDATVIRDGVKLDNMCHVGHNAELGENVVSAAQTGISGSSKIGRNVLLGGQVGIADHVTIEDGTIIGAQAGVPSKKTLRGAGVVFWGTPARPIKDCLKELAVLARLAKKK